MNLTIRRASAAAAVALLLSTCVGCKSRFRNRPLERYEPDRGYRFDSLRCGEGNTDDVFVFVAFSGGGTRAAALAYGVLQGLADVTLPPLEEGAPDRRLLDEVDMISSVSGGSFTAMAYGLWRDKLFDGRFKKRFLTRNVERDLLFHMLNPINLLTLPLPLVDSIDVASTYYDGKIFEKRTYQDLLDLKTRPFVVINSTDMARQKTFRFTQDEFDLLGSDLSALHVGWSVGASSAYPILLSPMRLYYYPGEPMQAAIEDALKTPEPPGISGRSYWARSLLVPGSEQETGDIEIDARNHKYLYLLDGGLADNLGLHTFLHAFRSGAIHELIEARRIRKLVVITVDAGTKPDTSIEKKAAAPGQLASGLTAASAGIYNNTALMHAVLRYGLMDAEPRVRAAYAACRDVLAEHCPSVEPPEPPPVSLVDMYLVDINFEKITPIHKQLEFMSMVTSFFLPAPQVDALIEEGGRQVREDPEIARLLRDLNAERLEASSEQSPGE